MINKEIQKVIPASQNGNEELNFRALLNTILRGKNFLFSIVSLVTLTTIIYSYRITSIWSGSFNVVIKEEVDNSNFSKDSPLDISLLIKGPSTSNKTQEFILKSPSVLMPVYTYIMDYYQDKKNYPKNLSYRSWLKQELLVEFQDETNVLEVTYKNSDQNLILEVLNRISNQYKNYSKKDREESLTKTINYLEEQNIVMKEKSKKSLYEFNKFTIENGLGEFDGVIDIQTLGSNFNKKEIDDFDAFKRFQSQFILLEKYESLYTNLSLKLKPNSNYLLQLEDKINNLKNSLKRPNEIILNYRELQKTAIRDELILTGIEEKLAIFKLEKIKKPAPWEIISTPTINDGRVFPQRKRMVGLSIIFSSLAGTIFLILKEKFSETIYDLFEYKSQILIAYIGTIFSKNQFISKEIILNYAKNILLDEKKSHKIGIINFSNLDSKEFLNDLNIEKNITFSFVELFKKNIFSDFSKFIVLIEDQKISKNDLILLNQYSSIDSNKFIGWFYVDGEKNF